MKHSREFLDQYFHAERPTCAVPGCNKLAHTHSTEENGIVRYRWSKWYESLYGTGFVCYDHHAFEHNMDGWERVFLKTECANHDGHLGIPCVFEQAKLLVADFTTLLHLDHIDGNPYNNDPDNLMTLCVGCHSYKTIFNKDHKSPGRKTLKEKYKKDKTYIMSIEQKLKWLPPRLKRNRLFGMSV